MHFIIKLSKLCNLRCNYCYEYAELANKERMPLEKVEFFFRGLAEYINFQPNPEEFKPHFILHGGEPLLLPPDYLRTLVQIQEKYLTSEGIEYSNSVQSNLVNLPQRTIDLLKELNLHLGISFDVFGNQRVDIKGQDSQEKVLPNIQKLIDHEIPFGAITVLHRQNYQNALQTYDFYNQLGIDYRILPIFSLDSESDERVKNLALSPQEIIEVYQQVAKKQFAASGSIKVYPLYDYFTAASSYLSKQKISEYNPAQKEWALIINVNGDIYNDGEAYLPEGLMGNIFRQSLTEIFASPEYQQVCHIRMQRTLTCRKCPFDLTCNQLPIAEACPSERIYSETGELICAIAKPTIEFMIREIEAVDAAKLLLKSYTHLSNPMTAKVTLV
ncbi:radical SAM protein [Rivularia sp. UHCC 0363]|uniref:radical SAM protein n=1 Tax=Rivularia sp. UHCC 0363 TaxID=3110244 RepID=UPI002B213395|nr:radical SAM protein [Rivularia sp. UHCC 0363]MEA5593511.1 radical SAM protein [Rivularia sp. UHCC 0363]